MTRRRIGIFVPVGLFALATGTLLRLYTHANYTEFAAGFLIGISLVLIIAGFVRLKRKRIPAG
ncbi:MAG TPA: hypothetical protein VK722_16440 [Candidatus Aquilonibacter sp.]|jgi:hypothetical protein|nr:hypothetical protein [Candidatus Aquilonibacter sp.]